jgi:hypothetical protein
MANDKGKGRRVEGSDDEEEHVPGSTMDTDGEVKSAPLSKKDKGKGRATTSTAPARSNGRQSNAKAGSQENGVSDQENEDDEEEKTAGATNGAADDKDDEPDLNKKQGASLYLKSCPGIYAEAYLVYRYQRKAKHPKELQRSYKHSNRYVAQ